MNAVLEAPLGLEQHEELNVWRHGLMLTSTSYRASGGFQVFPSEPDAARAKHLILQRWPNHYAYGKDPFEQSLSDAMRDARAKGCKWLILRDGDLNELARWAV